MTASDGPSSVGSRVHSKELTHARNDLTWLGHSAFRFDTPAGKRIYIDPFLHGNPKCPEVGEEPERVDVIALTHGHGDHVGDTVDAREEARLHGRRARSSLRTGSGSQGVENVLDPNKGGTVEVDDVRFTLTNALPLELEQRRRVHG